MFPLELSEGKMFFYSSRRRYGTVMNSHHYHDSKFEIYYMVSGKCSYFIDDKSYDVLPGDVVLIPEGTIHKTDYGKEEHSRLLIECSSGFIPEEVRPKIAELSYVYRNPDVTRDIFLLLKKIGEEFSHPDELTENALTAYMRILFSTLVRSENSAERPDSKNQMIEEVVSYLKENFSQEISLSAMAKLCFVSPEHLSRTFKKETGFGFSEYLTLLRLRQAEYMLKEGDEYSISEIAYRCGFNDSNYFSDKFKKTYGTSPLKYSKDYRKQ